MPGVQLGEADRGTERRIIVLAVQDSNAVSLAITDDCRDRGLCFSIAQDCIPGWLQC